MLALAQTVIIQPLPASAYLDNESKKDDSKERFKAESQKAIFIKSVQDAIKNKVIGS